MLGIIGVGSMGGAICRGICNTKAVQPTDVGVFDIRSEVSAKLSADTGVLAFDNCAELIAKSDMILLAVKPHVVEGLLTTYKEDLAGKCIISIAAGWTAEQLRTKLDRSTRVLCAMPNTAAMVGASMTAFSKQTTFIQIERVKAEQLFSAIGKVVWVEEKQLPAVIGISGSGPAYAFMFLQALADAGVEAGLSRTQAQELAAQMLLGAARMVQETGLHPEALKDMVCSPAGTTIAAVHALENGGFRGNVMDAVATAAKKAGELV